MEKTWQSYERFGTPIGIEDFNNNQKNSIIILIVMKHRTVTAKITYIFPDI